jgi:hypothetical protein
MIAKPNFKAQRKKEQNRIKREEKLLYEECIRDMPNCMWQDSDHNGKIEIHHIIYTPIKITEKGKLIPLCLKHHKLVHTDQKKYRPILLEIVKEFYKEEL